MGVSLVNRDAFDFLYYVGSEILAWFMTFKVVKAKVGFNISTHIHAHTPTHVCMYGKCFVSEEAGWKVYV